MLTNLGTLNRLLSGLPPHILAYFASIEGQTSERTRINYAYSLLSFFKRHESDLQALQAITAQNIYKYLNALHGEHSRARDRAAIRSFFAFLCRMKYISSNPALEVEPVKIHDKPIVRLDAAEAVKVLNVARNSKNAIRDKAILTLFLHTGIRVSELVGLNLSDIDFEKCSFVVTRKGGNTVRLYFSEEVKRALQIYIQSAGIAGETPLFVSIQGKRLCVRSVERIVKEYAQKVTLKKITPHKLRSSYGTFLYEATGDIYLVADVLGHKDVNTTRKHYADMTDERRKSAADKVKL